MPIETGVRQTHDTHFVRIGALLVGLGVVLGLALMQPVRAVTPISQSYISETDIPVGSIVSLKDNTSDQIVAATTENAGNIFGVTINTGSSLLSISNGEGKQIQVATSGNVPVLLSDYNGPILQGDSNTASPIAGVGMKATNNVRIIGLAQSDLNKGEKSKVKTSEGEKEVIVGQVPLLVNVSYFFKEPEKSIIPENVQKIVDGIAGRKVDSTPIVISAAIFFVMLIVVVAIIYTMIRSSIISIGRNPLSQATVYRNLIQLSALVIGILTVGVVSIYLVLSRL